MPDHRGLDAQGAEQAARTALRSAPATASLADAVFRPVPGGLSNFAWHVIGADAWECFVRYARGRGERLGADHAGECRVLDLTARRGLSPPIVRCDPAAHLLVTRWIDARRVGRPLRSAAALTLVARALATLHRLPVPGDLRPVRFEEQARLLEAAFEPEPVERSLRSLARDVFAVLRDGADPPVLCHHDLNPLNLLLDRDRRLWLVDWEYAGLGDAAVDLASFANQHALEARQRAYLLDAYRRAGRAMDVQRFDYARWAFDYVQWAWYRAAVVQPEPGIDAEVLRGRAAKLAASLQRRARRLLRCNNATFAT